MLEMERKMNESCFDPALHVFKQMLDCIPADHQLRSSILSTHRDLRFLKMFFLGLAYQEQSSEDGWRLRHSWSKTMRKIMVVAEMFGEQFEGAADAERITSWEPLSYHLRRKIEKYKPVVKEICILVLGGAFMKHCRFEGLFLEYGDNTTSMIHLILENLGDLDPNFDLIIPVKQQFAFIEGKFKVFGSFAAQISCLACLYWIGDKDHKLLKSDMGKFLTHSMQKYMPYSSGIVALYMDVFDAETYYESQSEVICRLTVSYVDFLLEHLNISEILHEGLMLLSSFVMDQLREDSDENRLLLTEVFSTISEVPSLFCDLEANLSCFLHKIDRFKVQVGERFVVTPLSPCFNNCPTTNAIGFLDSLLANSKKMLEGKVNLFAPVKKKVKIVYEQLAMIRPFVQNMSEVRNEDEKLRELWSRTVDTVYFAEYAIKLCPMTSWYGMICLPHVIESISIVKSELEKIDNGKRLTNETVISKNALLPQATSPNTEGAFIGFEEDAQEILDHLVKGRDDLTIVSISGMPGQGKTTLAKRIYNDCSTSLHFHKRVWCYVSKDCRTRELFDEIARDVCGRESSDTIVNMEEQDLIEHVWRSLKGNTYLIVLDDIWDVEVWKKVQLSFPNDRNGSRILCTSRNNDLASQADPNAISHRLRLFSEDESWELMEKDLFSSDVFSQEFLDVGKQIAVHCNRLPLAVALMASLLSRTVKVLEMWKEIAENLKSHLAGEGCMHVIQLSYKYLPDHLKPCFLYFGAFARGEKIRGRKLRLLWIAEGFVKDCSEATAKEYMDHLVSQSLVAVTERSCTGGIKTCRVHHDLLYDLCLEKAVEDSFIVWANEDIISGNQRYDFFHRVSFNLNGPSAPEKSVCIGNELLTSQMHTLLFNSNSDRYDQYWSYFLSRFEVLTVLDLKYIHLSVLPEVIMSNIHLRYLAIHGNIKDIPGSVVNMWSLETLIVVTPDFVWLPDALWEMDSLKCVDVREFRVSDWKSEPSTLITSNIEVLSGMVLKYDLITEEFLRQFPEVKELKCSFRASDSMCFSIFGSLEELESLHIRRDYYRADTSCRGHLPTLNFPQNLKELSLRGFKLSWSVMSTIGKLPNLEVLKLLVEACAGEIWDLEDGSNFLKLRYLKLHQMNVKKIDDSGCDETPFPCLQKLLLWNCEKLEEIPSRFEDINTLDTIDVSGSSSGVSDSARSILEVQRDMGNDTLRVFGLVNEEIEQ